MKNKINEINNLVLKGKLPIAFFNSKIVNLDNEIKTKVVNKLFIPRYKQFSIPRAVSNTLISKIYEIF